MPYRLPMKAKKPTTPTTMRTTRKMEKLDLRLIGAPQLGHDEAAVETDCWHSGHLMRAIIGKRLRSNDRAASSGWPVRICFWVNKTRRILGSLCLLFGLRLFLLRLFNWSLNIGEYLIDLFEYLLLLGIFFLLHGVEWLALFYVFIMCGWDKCVSVYCEHFNDGDEPSNMILTRPDVGEFQ